MVIANASAAYLLNRGGTVFGGLQDEEVEGPAAVAVAPEGAGQGVASASAGRDCCSSEHAEKGASRLDIFPGVMGAEVGESG